MSHKRIATAGTLLEGDALTRACVGIGMRFATRATRHPNIEDTILAASIEGMERDDLRLLAVLVTWLGVHRERIHADRLIRAVRADGTPRVRAFWAAIAAWFVHDRRFAKLAEDYDGERIELLPTGTDFQIRRQGEDERFANSPLRVANGVLRDRASDVASPEQLAKVHRTYYWRTVIGPSYRADLWAANEADPNVTAADLARRTYASFASAWQVKKDASILGVP